VDVYVDGLQGDYVGVQYYSRQRVDPAVTGGFAPPPPGVPLTQMGWEIYPEGLYAAIADAARSGLPVIVTENGIATADDAQRIAYLHDHLVEVKRALDDGIDVRGYLCWSAFDNFEWNHGYAPTFGLIGIDRANGLERVVRPSARAFGELARSGRLEALRTR
jgi:beta-glucosidase